MAKYKAKKNFHINAGSMHTQADIDTIVKMLKDNFKKIEEPKTAEEIIKLEVMMRNKMVLKITKYMQGRSDYYFYNIEGYTENEPRFGDFLADFILEEIQEAIRAKDKEIFELKMKIKELEKNTNDDWIEPRPDPKPYIGKESKLKKRFEDDKI